MHDSLSSSLAYIFSGAAQGACALRVTVGHRSMSDVSLTSIHECHSRTPQHVGHDLCSAMTVSVGHLGHVNAAITSCVRMCDRFVYDADQPPDDW